MKALYTFFYRFTITGWIRLGFAVLFLFIGIKEESLFVLIIGAVLLATTLLTRGSCGPGGGSARC